MSHTCCCLTQYFNFLSQDEWFQTNHLAKNFIESSQTAGFDADSEGSDNEIDCQLSKAISVQALPIAPNHLVNQVDYQQAIEMDTTTTSADCNGNSNFNGDSTATNDDLGKCVTTPPVKSGATKRTRQPDASKFNRSNRKSKNCAIFYFKHLDTDGENKDWSSQASEASEVSTLLLHSHNFRHSRLTKLNDL